MASWRNLSLQYVHSLICIFGLGFGINGGLVVCVVPRMHSMSGHSRVGHCILRGNMCTSGAKMGCCSPVLCLES
jgi:hypothetical protein